MRNKEEINQMIEYMRMKQDEFRKKRLWSACLQYGVKIDELKAKLDYMNKHGYE